VAGLLHLHHILNVFCGPSEKDFVTLTDW